MQTHLNEHYHPNCLRSALYARNPAMISALDRMDAVHKARHVGNVDGVSCSKFTGDCPAIFAFIRLFHYPCRMLKKSLSFQHLQAHFEAIQHDTMRDWFQADPERFYSMSAQVDGLFLDYSKNRLTLETMRLLMNLADECGLPAAISNLFTCRLDDPNNHHPALHTALRLPTAECKINHGAEVASEIDRVRTQMIEFVEAFHAGRLQGATGRTITQIVNIGIGGSHLGAAFAIDALTPYHLAKNRVHFIANIDGHEILDVLAELDLETCIFLISSKSFNTQETLLNAETILNFYPDRQKALASHFYAITANQSAALKFGIDKAHQFPIWEWVGGRFSLWSAIGLPIACAIGIPAFFELLAGGNKVDEHFKTAPLAQNVPVILAMISIWYSQFFKTPTHALFPYYRYLHLFPEYIMQLSMESNGKSLDRFGVALDYPTGVIQWGGVGCNGQHAFHQLLHQGSHLVPCDFILPVTAHHDLDSHHHLLIANCLSQSQALMQGRNLEEWQALGYPDHLAKQAINAGNKPSNTLLLNQLTPQTLGNLLALYEHKTFVQSVIWGTNAFDQYGVELGKDLAKKLYPLDDSATLDGSTRGLMEKVLAKDFEG